MRKTQKKKYFNKDIKLYHIFKIKYVSLYPIGEIPTKIDLLIETEKLYG